MTTNTPPTHVIAKTRTADCEHHGQFEQILWAMDPPSPAPFCKPFWSKCPVCDKAIQLEQDDLAAKARGTTNEDVRTRRVLQEAGVPPRHASCSLHNFNTALPKQKAAHKWASDYAYKFEEVLEHGRSCALVGNQGTGKTHLAVAIIRHVLKKGGTARYVCCADLLARFKATHGSKATETDAQVMADLTRCDLLAVDEIGRHQDTSYDQASLFRVFDHRYQQQKPTLMLSNLPDAEFAKMMGSALIDRLREGGGGKVAFQWESQRAVDHGREERQ